MGTIPRAKLVLWYPQLGVVVAVDDALLNVIVCVLPKEVVTVVLELVVPLASASLLAQRPHVSGQCWRTKSPYTA